jgi:hypothetical protein
MNIEEFKQKKAELDAQIREHGKAALIEGFKGLFDAHPELEAVRWNQYTAYFNDGEPCTFSVHDFHFKSAAFNGHGAYDEDAEFRDNVSDYRMNEEQKEAARPAIELFNRIELASKPLQGSALEDVYLAAFGDHSEITVTRDLEVTVDEYDHD